MRRVFCATCLVLFLSLTTMAQDVPKAELFGGYSWAGGQFHGADLSITGNVNRWFGVMANYSVHHSTENDVISQEKQRADAFLLGPRFAIRKRKRVTPFAYALFGATRLNVKLTIGNENLYASDTGFGLALGGGLDVKVNDHLAIRAFQLDYFRPSFFGETHNRGRLAFGVVIRFGKK
jgi:opacity protein-like surface antigen